MSSPLETQAKTWVQTISNEQTVAAYQQVLQSLIAAVQALWDALKVTWDILKETGKLVWLFLCLGLVAFDWLWDSIRQLIEKAKGLSEQNPGISSETSLADTGKALLEASKTGAVRAVSQAREQLGLPKVERQTTTPAVKSSPAPVQPSVPAPAKSSPASQPETAKESDVTAPEDESD